MSALAIFPVITRLEENALHWFKHEGGSVLSSKFDGDGDGCRPSKTTIKSLMKIGLAIITPEESDKEGFVWTPMVELTTLGAKMAENAMRMAQRSHSDSTSN